MSKSDKPYVNNQDGTYLTLEVLAAILEALSDSGTKCIYLILIDSFKYFCKMTLKVYV